MKYKNVLGDLLVELKKDKLSEMHNAFRDLGEMMYAQKSAFVEAGFTENQAMEIVIADYIDNKRQGGN